VSESIEQEKARMQLLNEGLKLKWFTEKTLNGDTSFLNFGLKNEQVVNSATRELESVQQRLIQILIRWEPGVDD